VDGFATRIALQGEDTHAPVAVWILLYGYRRCNPGYDVTGENSIVLKLIKPVLGYAKIAVKHQRLHAS
jgi:hypothetical protein